MIIIKDVPIAACGMAGQMAVAAQPGERAKGHIVKITCKGRS